MKFFVEFNILVCVVAFTQSAVIPTATLPQILPYIHGIQERIIQGSMAVENQFPHQGFALITRRDGLRSLCGASLIHPSWAITAGHCLEGAAYASVAFGHTFFQRSTLRANSRHLFVHPEFYPEILANDVALIGFDLPLPIGDNIKPIRIGRSFDDSIEGQVAIASGFGLTSDGGSPSPFLNFVHLRIISNAECANYYGIIDRTNICAVGITSSSQGICQGDSGGPLIIGTGDNATLIGIVSFGSDMGCSAGYPSGFVRPSEYIDWISSVTNLPAEEFVL